MATLQERRLGYHSRAGLEPGTSRFSTLRINHYAARGMYGFLEAVEIESNGPVAISRGERSSRGMGHDPRWPRAEAAFPAAHASLSHTRSERIQDTDDVMGHETVMGGGSLNSDGWWVAKQ
jgi:hypothetical protein